MFVDLIASYRSDFQLSEEESVSEAIEELRIRGIVVDRSMLNGPESSRRAVYDSPVSSLVDAINHGEKQSMCTQLAALRASPTAVQQMIQEGISISHAHVLLDGALSMLDEPEDRHFLLCTLRDGHMKQINDFNFNESIFKRLLQVTVPLLAEHEELLFASILRALAAGTRKCNKAKQLLFSENFPKTLVRILSECQDHKSREAGCELGWSTLTDDTSSGISSVIPYAELYREAGLISALVEVLRNASNNNFVHPCRDALKFAESLMLNEQICRQFVDADVLTPLLQILGRKVTNIDTKVALGCLRKLAVSDFGKKSIVDYEGLEILYGLLCSCMHDLSSHISTGTGEPDSVIANKRRACVLERTLSVMSAISLRNKQVVSNMFSEGYFAAFMEVMHSHLHNPSIARQCCMLIRNCAVQEKAYQCAFLNLGAEELLRSVKTLHPNTCSDVGSAALRDLNCENYNQHWNPKTLVLGTGGVLVETKDL